MGPHVSHDEFKQAAQKRSVALQNGTPTIIHNPNLISPDGLSDTENRERMAQISTSSSSEDMTQMMAQMNQVLSKVTFMEKRIESLESDCRVFEKQLATLEYQNWEFPLSPIPREYWLNTGHDEQYADNMDAFLARLEQSCHQLRSGLDLEHMNITLTVADAGFEHTLLYDEMLLSHWLLFVDSLQQSNKFHRDPKKDCFMISKIHLPKKILDLLQPLLGNMQFEKLHFESNAFGRNGTHFVLGIMNTNKHLKELFFGENIIEEAHLKVMCSLIERSSVYRLTLRNCGVGNPQMLSPIIDASNTLKFLDLSNNKIGSCGRGFIRTVQDGAVLHGVSKGTIIISKFLRGNDTLEELRLNNNDFNDADAVVMAAELLKNKSLKYLELESNKLTKFGATVFSMLIFNNTSFNIVEQCNHVCYISVGTPSPGNIRIPRINYNRCPSQSKRAKIFALLCPPYERNFNLKYLKNIPPEIIPQVLKFVQHYPPSEDDDHDLWRCMMSLLEHYPLPKMVDVVPDEIDQERNDESLIDSYLQTMFPRMHSMVRTTAERKSLDVMFEVYRRWAVPLLYGSD